MGLPPGVEWACPYENPPPVIYDNLTLYNVDSLKNSGFIDIIKYIIIIGIVPYPRLRPWSQDK